MDTFSFPWADLYLYAFPPFTLIRKVLATLRDSDATMLLLTQYWPNQTGFPLITELLVDYPLRLPPRAIVLRGQTEADRGIPNIQLCAWKLSAGTYVRRCGVCNESLARVHSQDLRFQTRQVQPMGNRQCLQPRGGLSRGDSRLLHSTL